MSKLAILVGTACNFRCKHCSIAHLPPRALSRSEEASLRALLSKKKFESVLFVGGEPTLYIDKINRVLAGLPKSSETKIYITTNGYFAKSRDAALKTLTSFHGLDAVQLSFDKYHQAFTDTKKVEILRQACLELGLKFSVLMSIQSPLDLTILKKLKNPDKLDICVQGVQLLGAASDNCLEYEYPSFDKRVLTRSCPNVDAIVYICGEGFSTCCTQLVFKKDNRSFVHKTIKQHMASKFYKMLHTNTFRDLLRKSGISQSSLPPRCSHPCNLCSYILDFQTRNKMFA